MKHARTNGEESELDSTRKKKIDIIVAAVADNRTSIGASTGIEYFRHRKHRVSHAANNQRAIAARILTSDFVTFPLFFDISFFNRMVCCDTRCAFKLQPTISTRAKATNNPPGADISLSLQHSLQHQTAVRCTARDATVFPRKMLSDTAARHGFR
jgi:hypothetical protein